MEKLGTHDVRGKMWPRRQAISVLQEREDAIKSRWEVEREAADCSGALVPTVYARHRPY